MQAVQSAPLVETRTGRFLKGAKGVFTVGAVALGGLTTLGIVTALSRSGKGIARVNHQPDPAMPEDDLALPDMSGKPRMVLGPQTARVMGVPYNQPALTGSEVTRDAQELAPGETPLGMGA